MSPAAVPKTPATPVHSRLRANTSAMVALEVERAELVVTWVQEHTVDGEAAKHSGIDGDLAGRGLTLAGEGAPVVDDLEFCSLAASLGQSLDGATASVGEIVELAFRLPLLWQRVRDGQVRLWRARRVAQSTTALAPDAAAWVDRQVAPMVTSCSAAQVERTVTAAMETFDPEAAAARRRRAADRRRFDVHVHEAGDPVAEPGGGTIHVDGLLDAADALDLDAAVRAGAAAVGRISPDASENVCRSIAVGELARGQRPLPLPGESSSDEQRADESAPGETAADANEGLAGEPPHRTVTLYLHLDAAAIGTREGAGSSDEDGGTGRDGSAAIGIGRCENLRSPVTAEQVRQWCQSAGRVLVRPVIDLADNPRTDAYEATPRMREQIILRDGHCVFPYCARSARRADLDHIQPYESRGPTEPANLAPLCRRHHRAKTFIDWEYAQVTPGTYLWHDPHGQTYLVTGAGTYLVPSANSRPSAGGQSAKDPQTGSPAAGSPPAGSPLVDRSPSDTPP